MKDILRLSVPLTVWIAAFSGVYGLQALICSGGWDWLAPDAGARRLVLTAAWLGAVALQALMLLALRSRPFASPSSFVRRVSLILAATALVATLWTLFPAAASPACL